MAVPNVSEGRSPASVEAIAAAFTAGGETRLLDVHRDADHHRAVFTLAGSPGSLAGALAGGAVEAVKRVDIGDGRDRSRGTRASGAGRLGDASEASVALIGPHFRQHPHVGAVDVVPVVYLDPGLRGAACAEALVAAEEIGALGVPVFLYGELGNGRTRAELRRGGIEALAERIRCGELTPDFGPPAPHPTAGATLVGARPPLVAFNLELAPPATVADARRIAGLLREGGAEGLAGVRAIGVALDGDPPAPQVSFNVERPTEVPLRAVVEAVRAHAAIACAELVGLAPAAALEGFPAEVPMAGFDPARHVIENALRL